MLTTHNIIIGSPLKNSMHILNELHFIYSLYKKTYTPHARSLEISQHVFKPIEKNRCMENHTHRLVFKHNLHQHIIQSPIPKEALQK